MTYDERATQIRTRRLAADGAARDAASTLMRVVHIAAQLAFAGVVMPGPCSTALHAIAWRLGDQLAGDDPLPRRGVIVPCESLTTLTAALLESAEQLHAAATEVQSWH